VERKEAERNTEEGDVSRIHQEAGGLDLLYSMLPAHRPHHRKELYPKEAEELRPSVEEENFISKQVRVCPSSVRSTIPRNGKGGSEHEFTYMQARYKWKRKRHSKSAVISYLIGQQCSDWFYRCAIKREDSFENRGSNIAPNHTSRKLTSRHAALEVRPTERKRLSAVDMHRNEMTVEADPSAMGFKPNQR
jgi:hypothetical protein